MGLVKQPIGNRVGETVLPSRQMARSSIQVCACCSAFSYLRKAISRSTVMEQLAGGQREC